MIVDESLFYINLKYMKINSLLNQEKKVNVDKEMIQR
jgi:hypothetical protein